MNLIFIIKLKISSVHHLALSCGDTDLEVASSLEPLPGDTDLGSNPGEPGFDWFPGPDLPGDPGFDWLMGPTLPGDPGFDWLPEPILDGNPAFDWLVGPILLGEPLFDWADGACFKPEPNFVGIPDLDGDWSFVIG